MQYSASPDSKSFDEGPPGQSLAVRPDKHVLMLYRPRGELASVRPSIINGGLFALAAAPLSSFQAMHTCSMAR